jgi:hypothetical protein
MKEKTETLTEQRDLYRRLFIALYEGQEPTEEMRLAYVEEVYPNP